MWAISAHQGFQHHATLVVEPVDGVAVVVVAVVAVAVVAVAALVAAGHYYNQSLGYLVFELAVDLEQAT